MKRIRQYLREANDPTLKVKKDSVKAIVRSNDTGGVLLLRRTSDDLTNGRWDLPGGHMKKTETREEALRREIKEETNLEVNSLKFVKTITFDNKKHGGVKKKCHLYKTDTDQLSVILHPAEWNKQDFKWDQRGMPEHSEYKWIHYKDELERMPMKDEMKEVIMKQLKDRENP